MQNSKIIHQLTSNLSRYLLQAATTGILLASFSSVSAQDQLTVEMNGTEAASNNPLPVRDPTAREQAFGALPGSGLLLIPESTNDRVMAFDPTTGDLIDADFIPADPTNLSTPIHAILAADGNSILV